MSRTTMAHLHDEQHRGDPCCDTRINDEFQRRSSAATLSDLELLVYPDLLFALVLANIMSPRVWQWRDDPWFSGIDRLSSHRRIMRVKQYIVDRYAFNLDLHTWGLTTQQRELARFAHRASRDDLCRLSPFFGCPGDRHYFDVDIRTEFGLEQLPGDVIPYWKTETVEAMDAFRHGRDDGKRAGECVSLAALYAAALFIVARVPLEHIYIMVTPLHCQLFVDVGEGMVTNNRRVVTKPMWFNGSELSRRARRSLENEQIVLVAHESGYAHSRYGATISPQAYAQFSNSLTGFLHTPLTAKMFGNFLRQGGHLQTQFQLRQGADGSDYYIPLEAAFAAEVDGSNRLTDATRSRLLSSLDSRCRSATPLGNRIILNDVERLLTDRAFDLQRLSDRTTLASQLTNDAADGAAIVEALAGFCKTVPQVPFGDTHDSPVPGSLGLKVGLDRSEVISKLQEIRSQHSAAELAFYVYRDLDEADPAPFVWAAVQRNPVSISAAIERFGPWHGGQAPERLIRFLEAMPGMSIYDGPRRLAQPDEVWNFHRGDGVEKVLLLANIAGHACPADHLEIVIKSGRATMRTPRFEHGFATDKMLPDQRWILPDKTTVARQ